MLKKTVTYTDFNGESVTEDLYFNLTKPELVEMEVSEEGGFGNMLRAVVDSKDNREILKAFKNIVTAAYGVRSEDGRRFIKNEEMTNDFLQSAAWAELFTELLSSADFASDFVNGIIPADLMAEAQNEIEAGPKKPQDRKPKASK